MRLLLTKNFRRFQRKESIHNDALRDALRRASRSLLDADLGGGLIKQRVARPGKGRSSGYRVVIAYRRGLRGVFLHGFAKSQTENTSNDELEALREIGRMLLAASEDEVEHMIADDRLLEVTYDDED